MIGPTPVLSIVFISNHIMSSVITHQTQHHHLFLGMKNEILLRLYANANYLTSSNKIHACYISYHCYPQFSMPLVPQLVPQ